MAVQLSSSYLHRSYQLLAKLSPKEMTDKEAFERASNIVYEWAKHKFSKIFRQMPSKKTSFKDNRDGNEIGVIYESTQGCFIFRGVHPDVSVPGRMWIIDIQICKAEESYWFAIRLSATSLHTCTEVVPLSRPGFVSFIIENIGISDVFQISKTSNLLSSSEDVDDFLKFLENPERRLPVVLITPLSHIESNEKRYMMSPTQISKDLSGTAHVFHITSDANEYLTECVGKEWSVFNGAVRTYYPGLSFEESDYYQHPLCTCSRIYIRNTIGSSDPDLCMHEIEDYIRKYTVTQRIPWEEKQIDFYLTAYQKYLQNQRNATNNSYNDLCTSYEAQIAQIEKQAKENLALADSYSKDCEEYNNQIDFQKQEINKLKNLVSTLRFQLKEATSGKSEEIPEDGSYTEIEDWISNYYPEKLIILPRAVRSLKNANYIDSALVYKCLKLLATSYYDYCTGAISYEDFTVECKKVDSSLEERGAITDVSAGMYGDTYYVQYRGKKWKLERHLAKGINKDQRYCLRIYFFWDDENQTIVIGDLPHHLNTSAT